MTCEPSLRVAERIRFLARAMGIVFLLGWGAWFWPLDDLLDRQGTPLGADFSMFYVAGQVVAEGDIDQLYNQAEHQRRVHELFPGLSANFCLPFRYPPLVALCAAPLTCFPYEVAWGVFTIASCGAFGLAIWLLSIPRTVNLPGWRATAVWACVGWPVALEVLIGGQASHFGLLIAVAGCALLQKNSPVAAGAVLALSAYKPNLLALFAIGVTVRYPRVVLGAIPIIAALVGLNCYAGTTPLVEYANLTAQLASRPWDVETPYWKVHSLATWFEFIAPGHGKIVTLLIGIVAALAVGSWWRVKERASKFGIRSTALAMLLVVNGLFNPYTPIYDLVLLAAAGWFATEAISLTRGSSSTLSVHAAQWLLAGLFFGPHLSQSLARSLGVQLFPMIVVAMAVWVVYGLGFYRRADGGVDLPALETLTRRNQPQGASPGSYSTRMNRG